MVTVQWLDPSHPLTFRTVEPIGGEELSVIEVGHNKTPSGRRFSIQRKVYIIHYVIDGCGSFNGVGFNTGDCYLTVPNEPELMIADDKKPYETVWIMFKGTLAEKLLKECGIETYNHPFSFSDTNECSRLIKRTLFEKEYADERCEAYDLHALFFRLLARHIASANYYRKTSRDETALLAAEYLEQNFNRPISIKNIAEYIHFSPNYLCSVFKEKFGVSPQEYLLNYRISRAKQLLETYKDLSVGEVAESTGFKDPLYFSRVFRSRVGITPSQCKKNAR